MDKVGHSCAQIKASQIRKLKEMELEDMFVEIKSYIE